MELQHPANAVQYITSSGESYAKALDNVVDNPSGLEVVCPEFVSFLARLTSAVKIYEIVSHTCTSRAWVDALQTAVCSVLRALFDMYRVAHPGRGAVALLKIPLMRALMHDNTARYFLTSLHTVCTQHVLDAAGDDPLVFVGALADALIAGLCEHVDVVNSHNE